MRRPGPPLLPGPLPCPDAPPTPCLVGTRRGVGAWRDGAAVRACPPLALLCENAVENGNAAVLGGLGAWPVRVVFPEKESLAILRPRLLC